MEINPYVAEYMATVNQQTAAWDKLRLGRFTGSGISALMTNPKTKAAIEAGEMSETAKKYIYEKLMEEVTGQSANEATSRAIDWGNEWEEHALTELRTAINCPADKFEFKPAFKLFNEYFGCSPDAFAWLPDFERVGVEIKCPWNSVNHFIHSQIQTPEDLKKANPDYYWQVMGNMLTHNLPAWIFASYDPRQPENRRLHYVVIEAEIDALHELCERMAAAYEYKQTLKTAWLNE